MRPLRLLLSLLSCVLAITLLLYITVPTHSADASSNPNGSAKKKGRLRALFSFSAPSLFPPSAIISLTDDNSTFFLARPAAFGPGLPSKGLSGQLWTGSGFGGDSLSRGGLTTGAEGELGCSDVPGWEDRRRAGKTPDLDLSIKKAAKSGEDAKKQNKRAAEGGASDSKTDPSLLQDGTDNHLQDASDYSWASTRSRSSLDLGKVSEHADIQSLQESAEIAGKVVLLSRGGCGFLEKVKWAQRRGGVAVIVGDDIRGGPLVTMYARGDTSNITIPALFTSHTTAHLLSSLVPSGGQPDDSPLDESVKLGGLKTSKEQKGSDKSHVAGPTFTQGVTGSRPTSAANSAKTSTRASREEAHASEDRPSWIRSLFTLFSSSRNKDISKSDSRRPPSSGNIDWILVEDWDEEEPKKTKSNTKTPKATATPNRTKPTATKAASRPADNFVIGVQDWRDPDLLPQQTDLAKSSKDISSKQKPGESKPKGGSTLPGSGEYYGKNNNGKESNWFNKLPWGKQPGASPAKPSASVTQKPSSTSVRPALKPAQHAAQSHAPGSGKDSGPHEGLWVTLTPTSMSNSPFFDTLVVLVVSPLVTLTVVYALLLLRSRIRRRRWRAPKSVVEQLPVRTYHTLNDDSTASNSPVATPAAGSPRTPLLQQATSSGSSRSRPRSRTAGDVPTARSRSRSADAEKDTSGLAAWRRKYGGRQKECVVCLEEYVDGVSRVMSLPCGHEFHVECITPWLTTRRRTCPICKGDVVRSLASSPSSSRRHHRPSRHPHSSTATAIPTSAPSYTPGPTSPFYLSTAGASAPAATSTGPARRPTSTMSSSPDAALYETATSSLPSQSAIASVRNDSPSAARPLSVRSEDAPEDPFSDDVYRRGRRRGGGASSGDAADELDLDLERGSTSERQGLMDDMDDDEDDMDGDEGGVVAWARDGWSEVRSWAGGFWNGGNAAQGRGGGGGRGRGRGGGSSGAEVQRAYDSDGEYIDRDR
ncbi:hypothetical protein IWX49DRAFT_519107 [Phyllosticta citricarpa]|uniref:RING-type E3 ubiquitin transferase n=2 Tax=Phyllosticta TaxID=121621 RepID=A0ABR1M3I9_9PEZI